ncbi:gastric triacylglycerol lipase-like [Sycon ciliatum]|uniref:gastric triacylglycerol lipase-like n=1 Tax=Sycon ciliatum TaxID=27933 RepID=UPI0020AABF2A|eukprot:scpid62156/ scgid18964/ Gastric triacylglycerol lipase; Lingual lipase
MECCVSWLLLAACLFGVVFSGDPEENLDACGIVQYHGYPCEKHFVVTDDGYILQMQRIPYGKKNHTKPVPGVTKPAMYLQHGLLAASTNWVANLVNESFGFLLADAGYDVWMGNVRGNTYGHNHTKLSPKSKAFWKFSFDEMIRYDVPAMITHILRTTGLEQIYYTGHSQGTMVMFAGLSRNKTLATQVKAFFALAPVTTLGHIGGAFKELSYIAPEIIDIVNLFGDGEFLPSSHFVRFLAQNFCDTQLAEVCENILFVIAGYDKAGMNETRLPVYTSHCPAGTSVQNIAHFAQLIRSNLFQMYNYPTKEENIEHYGQATPPLYPIEAITNPIYIFSGGKDILADPTDVASLKPRLQNLKGSVYIPPFEHLDFVWGLQAADLVYKPIIKILAEMEGR